MEFMNSSENKLNRGKNKLNGKKKKLSFLTNINRNLRIELSI